MTNIKDIKFTQESFPAVLSDLTIREYMDHGLLIENQISDIQMQPNSVDLTLGNTCKNLVPNDKYLPSCEVGTKFVEFINPKKEIKYSEEIIPNDSGIIIKPNQFVLMASREILNIPNGIISFVQGRSSIARIGIQTEQAGLIDAGFRGTITFEVFNQSGYPIVLFPGMRVAQVYFFHAQEALQSYGKDKGSKYSGQIEATGSKIHMDADINLGIQKSDRVKRAILIAGEYLESVYDFTEFRDVVMVTGVNRKSYKKETYGVYDNGDIHQIYY